MRFNGKFAQRFQAAAQCGHSGFIADIQLIRVIFRHHQRTARTCHRKFIARLRLHRPAAGDPTVVNKEINRQFMA